MTQINPTELASLITPASELVAKHLANLRLMRAVDFSNPAEADKAIAAINSPEGQQILLEHHAIHRRIEQIAAARHVGRNHFRLSAGRGDTEEARLASAHVNDLRLIGYEGAKDPEQRQAIVANANTPNAVAVLKQLHQIEVIYADYDRRQDMQFEKEALRRHYFIDRATKGHSR